MGNGTTQDLILRACSTRFCKMGGSDLAFALANKDRNRRVSSDQRPNLARENDQPSPATWSCKLGECSLLPEMCRLTPCDILAKCGFYPL